LPPHTFHEFHPSGGVRASASFPPTIVMTVLFIFPSAAFTDTCTPVRPSRLSDPVMMPVFGSSDSPSGRFFAENVSSPAPDAGILKRNGRPGVPPVMRG
jgi:hypothetical protein